MDTKGIIAAIKTALQGAAGLSYVADASIYITPDESLFYMTKAFPQITITDGGVEHVIEEGESWEKNYTISLSVYQLLEDEDYSLMGNAAPLIYGVLDIVADIHSVLFDNKLSLSGIEVAVPSGEAEAVFLEGDDMSVIKKTIDYSYRSLESNP